MAATPTSIPSPETSVLRIRKTVTSKKVEANRKNAKQSTGPRTARGRRNGRFNAVTRGLFAKHVAIPICDGYTAEKDFKLLLDALHQEYQPVGVYEEWLVVKIAESMWRLRRATRCESGLVRESPTTELLTQEDPEIRLQDKIETLTQAEKQLSDSGSLPPEIYEQLRPFLQKHLQFEEHNKAIVTNANRGVLLACLSEYKDALETYRWTVREAEKERSEIRRDQECLLSANEMDRIFRYEERMYRQVDWAVQRLLECQERRRTVEPADTPLLEERSQ